MYIASNKVINCLVCSFSLIILFWSGFIKANEKTDAKPNIILIVADYMGYADIGAYGATDIQTPALDTLATQGVRFSNYYSSAPKCIPSRASLMSGLYPAKALTRFTSEKGLGLPSEKNILLSELKAAGYATAAVGKWHLGTEQNFKPTDHGFDSFFGFHSWTLGYHNHLTSDGEPGLFRNDKLVNEDGYLTELFTNEGIKFIDESADKPFFLYLAYNSALPPYQRPNLPESQWDSGWEVDNASRADYVAMVEAMDQGINKILNKLQEHGLAENTLVIFTYDHGGRHLINNEPLFHGFSTLWEGGIRVPLIIRWPKNVKSGGLVNTPVIAMDLTASMLDAADRDNAMSTLDGISLFTIINKPEKVTQRQLFWRHGKMKAARQGAWKYIIDGHTQLLINLDTDISERKNLYYKYPKIAKQLRDSLANWEQSLNLK